MFEPVSANAALPADSTSAIVNLRKPVMEDLLQFYYPKLDDIPEMWSSPSEVVGMLANWAIQQSPWSVPNNLSIVLTKLHDKIVKDDRFEKIDIIMRVPFAIKEFEQILSTWLRDIPEYTEWNEAMKPSGNSFHFISAYDGIRDPRTDFIDLDALERNVSMGLYQNYLLSSLVHYRDFKLEPTNGSKEEQDPNRSEYNNSEDESFAE